jgi:integrase
MSKKRTTKRVKGQGSVFIDPPSPFWQLSYWNGWRQVRESARTKVRKEALELLQQRLSEVAVHKDHGAGSERVTINGLLTLLLEEYRREDKSDLYIARLRVKKHLRPALGAVRASKLASRQIREYIEARQKKAANATVNRELSLLRRAYNVGALEDPPLVYRVPRIPKLKEDNVREGFLERHQYRAILGALPDPVKPVFVVAYHLGMRTGELLRLKRDWIDLQEGLIYVNGRVTKNKKAKTAPIYGDMKGWLEMLLTRGSIKVPKTKELFIWEDGSPIKDFRGSWEKATEAAGFPGLLFHDLRRTAVRNMIRAGVPEKVAMEVSGHKTAAMLWRYNITDTRDIVEAGKRTARYLEEQKTANPAQAAVRRQAQ